MNVSNSQHCSNLQSENDFETHEEKMSVNSLGAVTLYALSYDHRDEADQYGVLYSGLNSCQVSGCIHTSIRLQGDNSGLMQVSVDLNYELHSACSCLILLHNA